ncbi:MAG TPA: hypothetical protein VKC60_16920 [Opitutaceae bacterium]|jgi:hypothetical protein|nr:hypothetical protein [Opitutaceae bacterium]
MPVRKRNLARHAALHPHEAAWLRGDRACGFVKFKLDEELQALWERYGDHVAFYWKPTMYFPEPKKKRSKSLNDAP